MAENQASGEKEQTDPARWVDRHGDYLYRYALLRVRRSDLAEDLVQETFLAALSARKRFRAQASEKTWLVGILKHKIVDHLRRRDREETAALPGERWETDIFDKKGNWRLKPEAWGGDPSRDLENKEFWKAFTHCLGKLPQRLASAFTLRELEDLESPEICKALDVSATNLWVMLHRARLGLWRCLEINWFGSKK